MKKVDASYYNEQLDFYIEKPSGWEFLPTQWALNLRNKTQLSNAEMKELLSRANEPLVYMLKPIDRNDIAHPTAQATCRPIKNPSLDERKWFIDQQIELMSNGIKNFSLIQSSTEEEVSGFSSVYMKSSFTIKNSDGMEFDCLGKSWTIFYYDIAFTIGLSGSVVNPEAYANDHDLILSSILLGASNDQSG
jgi:hypothetical protein